MYRLAKRNRCRKVFFVLWHLAKCKTHSGKANFLFAPRVLICFYGVVPKRTSSTRCGQSNNAQRRNKRKVSSASTRRNSKSQTPTQQGAAPDRLQPCVSLVPRFTSGFRRRVSLVVLSQRAAERSTRWLKKRTFVLVAVRRLGASALIVKNAKSMFRGTTIFLPMRERILGSMAKTVRFKCRQLQQNTALHPTALRSAGEFSR